jgi:hypothetical protein
MAFTEGKWIVYFSPQPKSASLCSFLLSPLPSLGVFVV